MAAHWPSHSAGLLDIFQKKASRWDKKELQEGVKKAALEQQTRRGCQGWCGPLDNSEGFRALTSLAGSGERVGVSDGAPAASGSWGGQSCSCLHQQLPYPALPALWWQQRCPTRFSRTFSSHHWSSPLLLRILRQPLSWQKQLGLDCFPAPQSLGNRWLWKCWCVKHFHVP